MKTMILCASLALAVAGATLAGGALAGPDHPVRTESGWFDMEKCEFCRNLLADPGLLPHMTWENHRTERGMIQVSTVAPEYAGAYAQCMQAMQALGNDMMTGKRNPTEVAMCGSCAAWGQLTMAGAKYEMIDGDAADVTIITADDPAVVARIHEYCDRNNKEMALLTGGAGADKDHPHKH